MKVMSRRERYRDASTAELLAEAESILWDLTEMDADLAADPASWDYPEESRAYLVAAVEDANAELSRRQRLRFRPGAPPWPRQWPDRRAEVEDIWARLDLADFIATYCLVTFERRGGQLWCKCPLPGHDDKTPSFSVHPAKQLFYCHGCHRGGDAFTFLTHMTGTDRFSEVVTILAAIAGVDRAPAGAVRYG